MKIERGKTECGNPCNPHVGDETEVILFINDGVGEEDIFLVPDTDGEAWIVPATMLDDIGDDCDGPCSVRVGDHEIQVMSDFANSWVNPCANISPDDPLGAWARANGRPLDRTPDRGARIDVLDRDGVTKPARVKQVDYVNGRRLVKVDHRFATCRQESDGRWVVEPEVTQDAAADDAANCE